jgi:hypothetical protein
LLRFLAIGAAALGLSACEATLQVYSHPEHENGRLQAQDLREGGVAFLTPSTVTGHEEDRQMLAQAFASTLRAARPDVRVVPLSGTISEVNRAGIVAQYRAMYADYRDTALFDAGVMRQVAKATGTRYLSQLKLANIEQGARGRFGLFGLNILQTHFVNMRVFWQIWDSRDGSVVWEGINEVTLAMDTGLEKPLTFSAAAEIAAQDLIKRLP